MSRTDATFNTNKLGMLLPSMVEITNTGATLPLAYCFITDSAASLEFMAEVFIMFVF